MDYALQEPRASRTHEEALNAGKTCIDCHRGIAHKLPPRATEEYEKLMAEMAADEKQGLIRYLSTVQPPTKIDARSSNTPVR
jgi:cytochrome c-type protein NapC